MNPTVDALTEICRIVAAVCIVRELPAQKLGAVVVALQDNGGEALASCLIGSLPFSTRPTPAELERLSDG